MLENKKVLITGGESMIGRHLQDIFNDEYPNTTVVATTHKKRIIDKQFSVDLLDYNDTKNFFKKVKPDYVINLAGYNGNIGFSKLYPADIFYQTSQIALNCLKCSHIVNAEKCVNILSSCAIADLGNKPLKSSELWNGLPNHTIEAHGLAKRMWDAYSRQLYLQHGFMSVCAIVNNCFGPYDNLSENKTKAVQGIINRVIRAKLTKQPSIECWGSGQVFREFVYAKDAARGLIHTLLNYNSPMIPLNISSKNEISIYDLTLMIADIVGYTGEILWDKTKPDGQLRKSLDTTDMEKYIQFEFTPLRVGLEETITWYKTITGITDDR
jgi:nucleoside-diphosphate-sugar epimerase